MKNVDDYWMSIRTDTCQIRGKDPQKLFCWRSLSGGRLTKIQATTRPDHVWSELCTKIGKAAQNQEKQEWAKEEPKLDTARRLGGIYLIDPDDEEYTEILRELERPVAPAMPC